jgi:hypothetical protein
VSTPEGTRPEAPVEDPAAPSAAEAPPSGKVVDDANDLRGFHFKRLMRKTLTRVLVGVFVVLAAIGGAVAAGPILGLVAAVVVLLIAVAIVFAIADSKAAESFYGLYAQQRGLALGGRTMLPPATPLLRKGDDRYAEHTFSGMLAENLEGTLALYTYEEETTDSKGNRETTYYKYTLGMVDVPECAAHVPELFCQQKFGFRALEKFEDVFRRSKERVKLESEALDEKYEIFAGKGQDQNWLRQLFAPTFIVWLTDSAPKKFAFELVEGTLCCYVHGHRENAADLDMVSAATAAVAKRLRDESAE